MHPASGDKYLPFQNLYTAADTMPVLIASWFVGLLGVYIALGVLFSIPFVLKGVGRTDPAAEGATIGFRLIIIPGVILLWPILLKRWLRGSSNPPEETSPHRVEAKTS